MNLIEAKNIFKTINNKPLINDVSFSIKNNTITTLVGQNGAGKTSLARIIVGLAKYDQGILHKKNNMKIAYLPQKIGFEFNMPISCRELLKVIIGKEFNDSKNFKSFLNYSKIKEKDISQISLGELQKLMLIATLSQDAELIILDEPVQYLDVESQREFYKLIRKKRLDASILMISHDLFAVMKNSDQVICLNSHICCTGKPTELNEDSDFKNALSEIGLYIHEHNHTHK